MLKAIVVVTASVKCFHLSTRSLKIVVNWVTLKEKIGVLIINSIYITTNLHYDIYSWIDNALITWTRMKYAMSGTPRQKRRCCLTKYDIIAYYIMLHHVVYVLPEEDRKSKWMTAAADRYRFEARIQPVEKILKPVEKYP